MSLQESLIRNNPELLKAPLHDFLDKVSEDTKLAEQCQGSYIASTSTINSISIVGGIHKRRVVEVYDFTRTRRVLEYRRIAERQVVIPEASVIPLAALSFTAPAFLKGFHMQAVERWLDATRNCLDPEISNRINEPLPVARSLPIQPFEQGEIFKKKSVEDSRATTVYDEPNEPVTTDELKKNKGWTPDELSDALSAAIANENVRVFPPAVRERLMYIASAGRVTDTSVSFNSLSRAVTVCMRYFDSNRNFKTLEELYLAAKELVERRSNAGTSGS